MSGRLARDWVPAIARSQLGLFTVRQAMAAGATYEQARRRREARAWVRVAGDAFALGPTEPSPWVDAVAAALTWPDSVVCLSSAALFHRLPVEPDGLVHVLVPTKRDARNRLQPHRFAFAGKDVVRAGVSRITSRRRTVLDCVGRLDERQAQSLLAWAASREVVTADDFVRAIQARPGAWGNTRRREAVTDLRDGALSVAEKRLHGLLRDAGISGWEADGRVYDGAGLIGRADVLFRLERVVVEVDGYAYHADRGSFRDDRRRQNRLVAAGWTVLRFTWADLVEQPQRVLTEIRAVLTRPRPR